MADQTRTTIPTPNPNPNHTPNRRQLLSGASALALGGAALAGTTLLPQPLLGAEAPTPLLLSIDPAYLAYVAATESERACNTFKGDEESAVYDALYNTYSNAERKLGATPATSLIGLRGKIERLAANQYWDPEDGCHESCLGLSLLADLRRMATLRRGWKPDGRDFPARLGHQHWKKSYRQLYYCAADKRRSLN